MKIRFYKPDDSSQLPVLFRQLGYPVTERVLFNRLNNILKNPDYYLIVAENDKQLVGFSSFSKTSFIERDGSYTRILALIVDQEYRKQGIAAEMLQFIEEWSRDNNCTGITLNSGMREERLTAHRFYERYGFEKSSFGFYLNL